MNYLIIWALGYSATAIFFLCMIIKEYEQGYQAGGLVGTVLLIVSPFWPITLTTFFGGLLVRKYYGVES